MVYDATDYLAKAGTIAKLLNKRLNAPKRYESSKINHRRMQGIIPDFAYTQEGSQYIYAVQAVDWVLLAVEINDVYAKATFELIAQIYGQAISQWGAAHETLERLQALYKEDERYSSFVQRLVQDEGLDLSDLVRQSAGLSPKGQAKP